MSVLLDLLNSTSQVEGESSLGDVVARSLSGSANVSTLLDCLCSSATPALYSHNTSRPPLLHDDLREFVSRFALPHSEGRGVRPNDRVMLLLETGPENALALLSIAAYHTCAPVNVNCTAAELREDAMRLNAKCIVTSKDVEQRLKLSDLAEELGIDVVYVLPRSHGPAGLFDMELMDNEDSAQYSRPRVHGLLDYSLVLHTSGTSGRKKVVRYSLRSLIVGTCCVIASWALRPTDVNFNMMPLFHVGGIVRNLLAPILSGGSTIMYPEVDPVAFWLLSKELRATWYYAAPTIHQAILSAGEGLEEEYRNTSIRMICNAAGGLLPSLATELRETFNGAVVLPSYGMTECMPIATPPVTYQLERKGCSGIACGPHLSIRNPNNLEEEASRGNTGAVCVRGAPTFEGYEISPDLKVPLDTSAFTSEGWFDSGDVGYMDDDGYLYITGRSKEIINKGGEVVSPLEVEEAVMTAAHDFVKETLAFAVEHDTLQETIGIVIVPVPGKPRISLSQLQRRLRDHLHPAKWPFVVVYFDGIPKNSAGKPLRIKLASRLGLGCVSDQIPSLHRHFEANRPDVMAPMSEPIPCSRVTVDRDAIEHCLRRTNSIREFALRVDRDGYTEAFVSVAPTYDRDGSQIEDYLSQHLPGYSVPEVCLLKEPLAKTDGRVDFETLQAKGAPELTDKERAVCEVVATILNVDPTKLSKATDFFLIGGNSLLLGQLAHAIRKQLGISLGVAALFRQSTISGIASLIEEIEARPPSPDTSTLVQSPAPRSLFAPSALGADSTLHEFAPSTRTRSQTHPLNLIVQALPVVFFYPLKSALTWALLLFVLSYLAPLVDHHIWARFGALLLSVIAARGGVRVVCPLAAILFKWLVIGRYRSGMHRMWSTYYLRWWIVDQSLRAAGKGIFGMHPSLEIIYYRLLGARIGKNVYIAKSAELAEFDLLTLEDGCRLDNCVARGFCVERDGYFKLQPIRIGRNAIINTYTVIAPGAFIEDESVYGPHASSHDNPSPYPFSAYNRSFLRKPKFYLQVLVAWPILLLVWCISYAPWAGLILLLLRTILEKQGLNSLEAVIWWFANPERVFYHTIARIARNTVTPLVRLALGILVKRLFGFNEECIAADETQLVLLRRYINSTILSQDALKQAFAILGNHYECVSIVYRLLGAKVGQRIYWPGSGFYCLEPELLEIGDDVVFGSRSELFTTDQLGSAKIDIGDGAMIADRVVVLPGVKIGRRTVMGSGALCKRDTVYADGETWMGNENGEAICLSKAPQKSSDVKPTTITPFGRAFYFKDAPYYVFPQPLIVAYNFLFSAISAAYWSIPAIASAQWLRQIQIHSNNLDIFRERWFRFLVLYGLIASFFVCIMSVQAVLSMAWVVGTKWALIGRRKAGKYEWDKSSYCQRWQVHLNASKLLYHGYGAGGVLATITGSAYTVWYLRALGAKIGKNCSVFAGGKVGLMTEPDLVELGDDVSLDDCSVVAHINSRGNFALNHLKIGNGCAMRTGSRLLSGASMEDGSILYEHSLLTSGEIAEYGAAYLGWPARRVSEKSMKVNRAPSSMAEKPPATPASTLRCPMCRSGESDSISECGHIFCKSCFLKIFQRKIKCPLCEEQTLRTKLRGPSLKKIRPSFMASRIVSETRETPT